MREIKFTNPHRQRHFDFFNRMSQPHFNLCSNVDISALLRTIKKDNLSFTPTIVYLISAVANSISAFRYRIREGKVVEHNSVHPSFSVLTEGTDVFSFCYVDYVANYTSFAKAAIAQINNMKTNPSMEDEEGRDDFLFLSTIPWVSFTSLQHAMHCPAIDSVPRITWGKYFEENGTIKMPLAVQAHHAVVDGGHMGKYFQEFQELANSFEQFL